MPSSSSFKHILQQYSDSELRAFISSATPNIHGDTRVTLGEYKEVQIHGPVCLATDVKTLSVPGGENGASQELKKHVQDFQTKFKCDVVWQDDLLNTLPMNGERT